jgi:uncharacterized membrane protein
MRGLNAGTQIANAGEEKPRITLEIRMEHVAWLLLILVTLGYIWWMGYETILRYESFKATAFDLGNYDQAIWNTIHGRLFVVTNRGEDWYGPPTRLGMHFEPILLPLSLLYLFFPDPRTLLITQTLALAAGALPVFLLTRKFVPKLPLVAPVMALGYLLNSSVIGLNIFDFHPVSLATPLLLYALLALSNRRYGWFLLTCLLAAACKEDAPFAIALLGILVFWKYKQPRLGIFLFIAGMCWGIIAFKVIIPHFYPGGNNYLYRYAALGSTPDEIFFNVLLHPWLPFTTYITIDRFYYLANLFRSTGFLVLLAPEWLLGGLFSLAVNLLSSDDKIYSGVFHYNAAIIPFVMLAAIHGLARFVTQWQRWRGEPVDYPAINATVSANPPDSSLESPRKTQPALLDTVLAPVSTLVTGIATMTIHSSIARSAQAAMVRPIALVQPRLSSSLAGVRASRWEPFSERMTTVARQVPVARLQWIISAFIVAMIGVNFIIMTPLFNIFWANHVPGSREQQIQRLLNIIPPDAAVSAGSNLNPHLTERQYVTVFPQLTVATSTKGQDILVQYVIVDLDNVFPEDKYGTAVTLNALINSGQFRILARADGVILLVRDKG